jgi:hypothetical protein
MQWTRRFWRYAALLGSSVILLQTTTGCPVDQTTLTNLVAQAAVQFLQAAMSGQYCSTA